MSGNTTTGTMSAGIESAGVKAAGSGRPARRVNAAWVKQLKERDDRTNFRYIAMVYAIMLGTIAATVWSFHLVAQAGLGWWWNIPAALVAIIIIGASQHQLGGIIHEGTHYILFKDRLLNEAVSDWLGAFPIYTSTYAFRLHHLAHHQFVNDPERDPNFDQAQDSGHWLDFPVAHIELLMAMARLLNPVNLFKYILARARYSALGVDSNPYADKDRPGSPWALRAGVLFGVGTPFVLIPLIYFGYWGAVAIVLPLLWGATMLYYWRIPDEAYPQSVINPVISHRTTAYSRISYLGLLYAGLSALEYYTGAPVWGYFLLLWLLPLFTTFPLFMILREWVQHGNADRGRYTNSRIFLVNPLVRYAVFPFGMDYHLPHHLHASVPHYNLRELHEAMRDNPEYEEKVRLVEGWVWPKKGQDGQRHPTVVEVLGPEYAPQADDVHVEEAVLEHAEINNAAAVRAQIESSRRQRSSTGTGQPAAAS